jgi:hypothetical protein
MRVAFVGAVALVIVACSGAAPTILDGPRDAGAGSETSPGAEGGSSGGSSGGHDAMAMGDDETDATTPPQDAALDVQEAAVPACMPSPFDGGACNSVAVPPSTVVVDCDATDPVPAPLGGVIHDGTYRLISATYYADGNDCPEPETDGVTWDVCGASWQISQNDLVDGQAQSPLVANATVVATGSSLAITLTCGLTIAPLTFGYDADATTLRLHTGGGATATSGRVDTFALQ